MGKGAGDVRVALIAATSGTSLAEFPTIRKCDRRRPDAMASNDDLRSFNDAHDPLTADFLGK